MALTREARLQMFVAEIVRGVDRKARTYGAFIAAGLSDLWGDEQWDRLGRALGHPGPDRDERRAIIGEFLRLGMRPVGLLLEQGANDGEGDRV